MKDALLFLSLILATCTSTLGRAQGPCPTDPQGLLDYVTQRFELQRGTNTKSQVSYINSNNQAWVFERVTADGKATLTKISGPDLDASVGIVINQDQNATRQDRENVDFTTKNYNFAFIPPAGQGSYKYSVTPVVPLKGRFKTGFIWLDPNTCSIKKAVGTLNAHSGLKSDIEANYVTVNGVYLASETLIKFDVLHGLKKGQVEVLTKFTPDGVMPPPALSAFNGDLAPAAALVKPVRAN